MGADEDVFRPQLEAFPNLSVPKWIEPEPGESLQSYAERFAKVIDPGGPCIIGGASFGGMLAAEMIPFLSEVKACVLIGSVSSPEQLPFYVKLLRPFSWLTEYIPFRVIKSAAWMGYRFTGPLTSPQIKRVLCQVWNSNSLFFHWAVRALLEWQESDEVSRTDKERMIHQIHGDKDWLLPIRYLAPDRVLEGGGHIISMKRGAEVNRFLREVISEVES